VGHVAYMGEMRNAYKIVMRKLEWKVPVGRLRHRWEDSIRMEIIKIGWEGMD